VLEHEPHVGERGGELAHVIDAIPPLCVTGCVRGESVRQYGMT
jgi:hypothetical protein